YEFLHHYYRANGLPLRNRLFGRIERWSRVGARAPGLVNRIASLAPSRWLLEKVAGIDRRRPLPAFAARTFTDWFGRRTPPAAAPRGEVVLFHDTFVTYNQPAIGRAAVELLEAAGYRVVLADKKCCGRPLISKGMLAEAREHAAWNVERLAPYAERGVAIVGLEPSCLLTLRDGGLVRVRARALRHLRLAREPPAGARREGGTRRHRRRRARHLLPPADRPPHGPACTAPGRSAQGRPIALTALVVAGAIALA